MYTIWYSTLAFSLFEPFSKSQEIEAWPRRDPFDPQDHAIGPCMYTVNDQYIKPITADAGNVSWALMKNPKGLPCDLFITHAWAEGVFEFIDKVLQSWPHRAGAAYVCFLSNPQNLDIGHLIATPEESPFAKALDSSRHVLAVPNRKGSIYARLWCVYEAFLAYSWNKPITTATVHEAKLAKLMMFILLCLFLFCLCFLCYLCKFTWFKNWEHVKGQTSGT